MIFDAALGMGDASSSQLPSSRLIASDSWGHEALGTSSCVDNAAFGYLLHPLAPAPKITHCRGDVQPFASSMFTR